MLYSHSMYVLCDLMCILCLLYLFNVMGCFFIYNVIVCLFIFSVMDYILIYNVMNICYRVLIFVVMGFFFFNCYVKFFVVISQDDDVIFSCELTYIFACVSECVMYDVRHFSIFFVFCQKSLIKC